MRKISILLLFCSITCLGKLNAQITTSLFAQTSEMGDMMTQYDADKESIIRFYSSGGSESNWWAPQRNSYNSPERRQRLLENIQFYLKEMEKLDFAKFNVNGKVDYILFKRNLEDEQYTLKEEDALYLQITRYVPFSERIYAMEKPRRRGIAVNGEKAA